MRMKTEADLAGILEQAKSEAVVGAHYRHYKGLLYGDWL
jgi:hypothetical protein